MSTATKAHVPYGRLVTAKVESPKAWAFTQEKLFEVRAPAGQLIVVPLGHNDDGIAPQHYNLRHSGESAAHEFGKAFLRIRSTPYHKHFSRFT
jgi:hypothetical protein